MRVLTRGASGMLLAVLLGVVAGAVGGGVVGAASAPPAAAHGVGGLQPSNYRTRVLGVEPAVPGLRVRAVDLGGRLELRNTAAVDVVVVGYDGEAYLRVGPRGVFENRRSPATYLNRSRRAGTRVPAVADATAPPDWHRISSGRTARWHDHRAHWTGATDPVAVQRDPGHEHLVSRWTLELRRAGRTITVRGDLRWIPGPSPWPWIALAVGLAAALVALARTRWWEPALGAALAALAVTETAHALGVWRASTASLPSRLGATVYSIGAVALTIVALARLARRGGEAAAPVALLAGLGVLIAGGLADLTTLTRSQLPTTLPDGAARAAVACALGLGAGVTAAAALHLRPTTVAAAEPRPAVGAGAPGPPEPPGGPGPPGPPGRQEAPAS